jgi:hypothetical protein
MSCSPWPLSRGGARARDIALVATDVDGTLTRRGKLDPAVMAAISALT